MPLLKINEKGIKPENILISSEKPIHLPPHPTYWKSKWEQTFGLYLPRYSVGAPCLLLLLPFSRETERLVEAQRFIPVWNSSRHLGSLREIDDQKNRQQRRFRKKMIKNTAKNVRKRDRLGCNMPPRWYIEDLKATHYENNAYK